MGSLASGRHRGAVATVRLADAAGFIAGGESRAEGDHPLAPPPLGKVRSATRHPPPATHHRVGEPSPHGLTTHHCRTREFQKNNGHPAGYEDKKVAKDYQKLCTRLREVEMDQALHHTPRYRRSTVATDAPPMQSSTSTASAPTQANSPHLLAAGARARQAAHLLQPHLPLVRQRVDRRRLCSIGLCAEWLRRHDAPHGAQQHYLPTGRRAHRSSAHAADDQARGPHTGRARATRYTAPRGAGTRGDELRACGHRGGAGRRARTDEHEVRRLQSIRLRQAAAVAGVRARRGGGAAGPWRGAQGPPAHDLRQDGQALRHR